MAACAAQPDADIVSVAVGMLRQRTAALAGLLRARLVTAEVRCVLCRRCAAGTHHITPDAAAATSAHACITHTCCPRAAARRRAPHQVRLGKVAACERVATAAIRALAPATLAWSNTPDYAPPKEFHALARAVSAPGTVHHMVRCVCVCVYVCVRACVRVGGWVCMGLVWFGLRCATRGRTA
jgi:hypothetical protein